MAQLRLLLGVHYRSMFGLNRLRYSHKKGDSTKRTLLLIGLPILALFIMGMAGAYSYLFASGLSALGAVSAVPVAMFTADAFLTLITSIAHGGETLLTFRDYDVQMSLPVSPRTVALSRLLIPYIDNLVLSLFIMLPACGVYAYFAHPAFSAWVVMALAILMLPLIPVVLGTCLGALISFVSARFRASRYIRLVLSLALFGLYFFFCFSFNPESDAQMMQMFMNVSGTFTRIYPLARFFSDALNGQPLNILYIAVISLAVFAVFGFGYMTFMRPLHSIASENRAHSQFRMKRMSAASPLKALYKREFSHYFSSTLYVMNTAIGPLMGVVLTVAAFIAGREQIFEILPLLGADVEEMVFSVLPLVICFFAVTGTTTAASISIEGSAHWLLQVIPVDTKTILRAKLLVGLTVLLPVYTVIPAAFAYLLHPAGIQLLMLFALPFFASVFFAGLGLYLNLRFHRFDWKNEQQVVKNGMATSFTMLTGMLLIMISGALIALVPGAARFVPACAAGVLLIGSVVLFMLLNHEAQKSLRTL